MKPLPLLTVALMLLLIAVAPAWTGHAQTRASGQLAIAGTDGNIYLYDIDAGASTPLTSDAAPGRKAYAWPTWSTDGWLAFFGYSLLPDDPYRFGIFLQRALGETETLYTAPDEAFTYAAWSPAECPAGNCRDLAVLYTAADGDLALRRVRTDGATAIDELSAGGPHYWDWSPDGSSMFWARYGSELAIYDSAADTVTQTFDLRPGFQRAVDWSPVDQRLLTAVRVPGHGNGLLVLDGDARLTLAEDLRGPVSFEWSPDGQQVAYLDEQRAELTVADSRTGEVLATAPDDVFVFFWSPDGARLAYLTITTAENDVLARRQGMPRLQWVIYDPAAGTADHRAGFLPSQEMIYYLRFFDQFARSHRLWSPDSRYLIYGEALGDGRSVVSLLDTQQPTPPTALMEGEIGVFSW